MTPHSAARADWLIVGGGLVGASIALGLARQGAGVLLVDKGPGPDSASRANFGQIWVQGKGAAFPPYRDLTIAAAQDWAAFAASLQEQTGLNLHLHQNGGLQLCLGEEEMGRRTALAHQFNTGLGEDHPARMRMLTRAEVQGLLGSVRLGRQVSGASFCALDGHVNPLLLWRAIHEAMIQAGVRHLERRVDDLTRTANGFTVSAEGVKLGADQVVLAMGNGAPALEGAFGQPIPVAPVRGQILVTEKLGAWLPLPTSTLRQTDNGSLLIGSTHEHVGFDSGATAEAAVSMAQRAVLQFPDLVHARLVRQWSGFRVMTPDGAPIYDRGKEPGLFLTLCHSGVGLSVFHSAALTKCLLADDLTSLTPFTLRRFASPGATFKG